MTEPIRTCTDHGPFSSADGRCPICDARGERLLTGDRRRRLSTFVSGALRHFPGNVGLELDEHGWVEYGNLVDAVERKYDWAEPNHVAAVIATDPKGRFERISDGPDGTDDGRVRASYGHSVDVDLESEAQRASDSRVARNEIPRTVERRSRETTGSEATRETGSTDPQVPDELYHGTAPANLSSIREEGLQPMSRQHVHLSGTRKAARQVGERHASDPVVLAVDAAAMLADGRRITKRGRETYTTDDVPPDYISFPGSER